MRSKRKRVLLSCLILTVGSGCSTFVRNDLPCPKPPNLTPITLDMQAIIPDNTLSIIAENQLLLKAHIKKLHVRLGCET